MTEIIPKPEVIQKVEEKKKPKIDEFGVLRRLAPGSHDANVRTNNLSWAYDDGKYLRAAEWTHCRDTFQGLTETETILFCHPVLGGRNVAEFIRKVELVMKHAKLTECGPTNWNRVMWIRPAKFWLFRSLRKSLLTALIRAGTHYDPATDNFDAAMNSVSYISTTREAVDWFIKGHTWVKNGDEYRGWQDAFHNSRGSKIKDMLTMKPISEKQLFAYALEKLGRTRSELVADYRREKFGHKTKESEQPPQEQPEAPV